MAKAEFPNTGANVTGNRWYARDRLGGLRRFAVAITVLNILGHTWFGFEQSWAHPLVALATAYTMELLLELLDWRVNGKRPRFLGGPRVFVEFLLPAHISGLAVSMLLYPGDRLMPVAFAAAVAMASKSVFRVTLDGRSRHFFNPSNFGITLTLLCFPWVGIAPPYQFTENLTGVGNWIFPAIIICSGSFLNIRYTRRVPLILAWLSLFVLQAVVRSVLFDTPVSAGWMPMTGVAFLLFTFYMVTDPPTTPATTMGQIAFGSSVAIVYCLLMVGQVVFGLFFSLTIVATVRGVYLHLKPYLAGSRSERTEARIASPVSARPPDTVRPAPSLIRETATSTRGQQ